MWMKYEKTERMFDDFSLDFDYSESKDGVQFVDDRESKNVKSLLWKDSLDIAFSSSKEIILEIGKYSNNQEENLLRLLALKSYFSDRSSSTLFYQYQRKGKFLFKHSIKLLRETIKHAI